MNQALKYSPILLVLAVFMGALDWLHEANLGGNPFALAHGFKLLAIECEYISIVIASLITLIAFVQIALLDLYIGTDRDTAREQELQLRRLAVGWIACILSYGSGLMLEAIPANLLNGHPVLSGYFWIPLVFSVFLMSGSGLGLGKVRSMSVH